MGNNRGSKNEERGGLRREKKEREGKERTRCKKKDKQAN